MKGGKIETIEVIDMPNQENSRSYGEKKNFKYLGKVQADAIKEAEMKEKIKKRNTSERENLPKTYFCSKNSIKGINTHYKILTAILKMAKGLTKTKELKDRKIDYLAKVLHPGDEIERLYEPRKETGILFARTT